MKTIFAAILGAFGPAPANGQAGPTEMLSVAAESFGEQIQRIKTKLKAAEKVDKEFKIFGAESHQYRINPPASEREVNAIEERYSLKLPECYRSFLTLLGNGGPSYSGSAAGPFYGIYPLGQGVSELVEGSASNLNRAVVIEPDMTEAEWMRLRKHVDDDDEISGDEYERERERIYGGLLPIGSQGCSSIHALVLNGPHTGKVVNLDFELHSARFAFEKNFLDWYERWLDEVIAGYLMQGGASWFGYTMGGDDTYLLHVYAEANSRGTKIEALKGLAKLATATDESCQKLLELCDEEDAEIRHLALLMLTKFAYPMARQPLRTHILSDDNDCLVSCQSINWYAKKHSIEWNDLLRIRLPTVNASETFRFISYLLLESDADFSEDFWSFCTHPDEDVRVTAFYSLGKLKNKKNLVELFLRGLEDPSARVVHSALQALAGVRDERLVEAYDRILDRFKTDENYVLTNLKHRLKEMGHESIDSFRTSR
ncbi:SMI1/KNR4 family protein [Rugamonas sp. FT107W]|uniref:SMI1/KNR4 family protein n=1 Tax=Duganella vulcania TaxID=2692166 RepID=A0A845HMI0_9BURK|nr:SMI1/KNR4 family protein [Duganella vulcania]MYN18653.1 SMI1/KNR4 family protein [Duganella vulcania]